MYRLFFGKFSTIQYVLGLSLLGTLLFVVGTSFVSQSDAQSATVQTTIKVAVCGNGIAEPPVEGCDGVDFAGETCVTQGFGAGTLSCTIACDIDTSACPPAPVPSSGGGGGVVPIVLPMPRVTFSGNTSPQATITLLRDAQIAEVATANPRGEFSVTHSGFSAGSYIFSITATDRGGRITPLITYPLTLGSNSVETIGGVVLPPTITTDNIQTAFGEILTISGETVPGATVLISFESAGQEFSVIVTANSTGQYFYTFNVGDLPFEFYEVRARSLPPFSSSYGKRVGFRIGEETIERVTPPLPGQLPDDFPRLPLIGDLNLDVRVNLVDFSILIFWFDKPNVPPHIDLNRDGRADIVDFSIMAYYWTG